MSVRQLTDDEYMQLIVKHPVHHFMGGCGGEDTSQIIYLTEDKVWLVSADDKEEIQRQESLMRLEAEDYHNQMYSRIEEQAEGRFHRS